MKKIVAIVLLCTFLFATGTIHALTLHYCAGNLASITFDKTAKGCGNCKTSKEGCCKDVTKIIKTDQYNKIDFAFDFTQNLYIPLSNHSLHRYKVPFSVCVSNTIYSNAPPSVHK